MPAVTVKAAVGAKRHDSAGSGSGRGYRCGRQCVRSDGSAGAKTTVTQGSVVVRARLVQAAVEAQSCRALAGAGGGSGYDGGKGSEAQGHGRDGSGRDWGGEEMV